MLRKFKLIQTFPGSLDVGDVVSQAMENGVYWGPLSKIPRSYIASSVENYPHLWKEIIDTGWEIYEYKYRGYTYTLIEEKGCWEYKAGRITKEGTVVLKDYLNIFGVRRTSDGEIFRVGDKITGTKSVDEIIEPKYTTIRGFRLEKDGRLTIEIRTGIILDTRTSEDRSSSKFQFLTIKKHVPSVWRIDFYGNPISVGDTAFLVNLKTFKKTSLKISTIELTVENSENYKIFASNDAANEYITMLYPGLNLASVVYNVQSITEEEIETLKTITKTNWGVKDK
ncbi:MAG TPA: hypothetical protein PKD00_00480 [Burkholderiales bacterium]|nr:hypothetical protein [Burkholderiales bacterium]